MRHRNKKVTAQNTGVRAVRIANLESGLGTALNPSFVGSPFQWTSPLEWTSDAAAMWLVATSFWVSISPQSGCVLCLTPTPILVGSIQQERQGKCHTKTSPISMGQWTTNEGLTPVVRSALVHSNVLQKKGVI